MCAALTQSELEASAQTADSVSVRGAFGKYKPIALIGRGGMGDIFLAMALGPAGFRKLVVVKSLRMTSEDDEAMRRMFLDEGRLAAHLNHPNVVQIFDVGDADGTPYIAMEYLDGQPLSRILRSVGRLDPRIAARIASDTLAGLHYAHELSGFDGMALKMVHRDLSPPNILVTYDGGVKLVDFGIAKAALPFRALTGVGTVKGKISYMAPEQTSRDDIDRRVDIFAMGAVLWEMLVGRRLVADDTAAAAVRHLVLGTFPSVSSELPDINGALEHIVARALEKNPDARYQTALEMREELESYLAQTGSPTRSDELSRLLVKHFAGQRAKLQEVLQACIAAADVGSAPQLPVIPRCGVGGDSSADRGPGSLATGGSRASLRDEAVIDNNPAGPSDSIDFRHAPGAFAKGKHRKIVGGALLAALSLLGGWFFLSRQGLSTPTAPIQLSIPDNASAKPSSTPLAPRPESAEDFAQTPSQRQMHDDGKETPSAQASGRDNSVHTNRHLISSHAAPSRTAAKAQTKVAPSSRMMSQQPATSDSPHSSPATAIEAANPPSPRTTASKRAPLVDEPPRAPLVE